jgi:hypothetical protein
MTHETAAKQFSFRLPGDLIERLDHCQQELQATGLDVNRADLVRMLLKHALDATHCNVNRLFGRAAARGGPPKRS